MEPLRPWCGRGAAVVPLPAVAALSKTYQIEIIYANKDIPTDIIWGVSEESIQRIRRGEISAHDLLNKPQDQGRQP